MIASDYYAIDFKGGSFYFGYERCWCKDCWKMLPAGTEFCDFEDHHTEWCFDGKIEDFSAVYTASDLGVDQFDLINSMNAGIVRFMGKYLEHIKEKSEEKN